MGMQPGLGEADFPLWAGGFGQLLRGWRGPASLGLAGWGTARVRPRTAPCSSQSTRGGLCYMGVDGQGLSAGQRASPRGPVLGHSHLDQCFQALPCNGPEDGDRGPSGALLTSW